MRIGISVIIEVFNEQDYILDTLEQMSKQDFEQYEVYIINTGSNDKTKKEIKHYIKNKPQFVLKTIPMVDSFKAKNVALQNVTGEYVLFADTSIIYGDNALSTFYNKAKEVNADLVMEKVDDKYKTNPLVQKYYDEVYNVDCITKTSHLILYDMSLGNKLLKLDRIKSLELRFIEAKAIAGEVFCYQYYINCNKICTMNNNILNVVSGHYTTVKTPLRYIAPAYINEIILGYTTIIDIASDHLEDNHLNTDDRNIYFKAIYRERYFSLYELIVRYYWTLRQQTVLMLKSELQRGKNHFNTMEWLAIQSLFNDIPLDYFPNSVAALAMYKEITIALYGEYEGDILSVIDTIKSFYGKNFLRFHIVVPKYIYDKLPKLYKLCSNITSINDFGKNSFYNKVLSSCQSEYILFTSDCYLYGEVLLSLYDAIKDKNFDLVTSPIHLPDEFGDGTSLMKYSSMSFVDYDSNNFDVHTDEAYDCILANKLIRTSYLHSIKMTFDGYDFTSCNTIMKNACILRLFTKDVILKNSEFEERKFKVLDLDRVRITEDKVFKKVLMFTLNGKGFVRNLSLLRDELINQNSGVYIEYFFAQLSLDDHLKNQKIMQKLKEYARAADLIITAHNFDQLDLELTSKQDFAIILPPHYSAEQDISGYVFAQKDSISSSGINKTNSEGTTIYDKDIGVDTSKKSKGNVEYITYGTPEVEFILNQTNIRTIKDKFNLFYPHSQDKKIIMITSEVSAEELFDGVEFLGLRDRLANNYFIVIKSPNVEKYLSDIPQNLSGFLVPAPQWINFTDQVMIADVLITTKLLQAYYFAPYNKYLYLYTGSKEHAKINISLSSDEIKEFNAMELSDFNELPAVLKSQIDSIGGARKATSKIASKLLH